jgi:hypothetical protein
MGRDKQLKVWVNGITAARISLRAEEAGTTLSEYIGELVVKDANEGGRADALAGELLEMQYLNAILLRTLLGRAAGEAEADKMLERARKKAHEQAQNTLGEIRSPRRKTG